MRTKLFVFAALFCHAVHMANAQSASVDAQMAAAQLQFAAANRQRDSTVAVITASVYRQGRGLTAKPVRVVARSTVTAGVSQPDTPFFVAESLLPEPTEFPVAISCDALPPIKVDALVEEASRATDVSPGLLKAVIRQESGFRPCAVSSKGALGLMQLMPRTASFLGVDDAMDPRQNVLGGARFLQSLLDRYSGDVGLALGAYNAGPARVDAAGGIPAIPETTSYVQTILTNLGLSLEEH